MRRPYSRAFSQSDAAAQRPAGEPKNAVRRRQSPGRTAGCRRVAIVPRRRRQVLQRDDFVAEHRLAIVLDLVEQQSRQVAAAEGDVAAAGEFFEYRRAEAGHTAASRIDHAQFAHVIADPIDLRQ